MIQDLMIGEKEKNTLRTKHGVDSEETIVKTCVKNGLMIFGNLLKTLAKNPIVQQHFVQIHQNNGAKTIFIGKSEGSRLIVIRNMQGHGTSKSEQKILITTETKTFKNCMVSLLSGIRHSSPNKMVFAQSVKSRKRLLSEENPSQCQWIMIMKPGMPEGSFAQNAIAL